LRPEKGSGFGEAEPDSTEDALIRRIAIVMVAAAVLGLLGFFLLAWRPVIAPIAPPDSSKLPG
jgi:hypothetical protein